MGSIVIPAYNEQAVIGRTLRSLLSSVGQAEHEIIVVCNACRDATASVAREFSPRVQVIETEQPGKCNAINLGERYLATFPRIYLDADIEVSGTLVPDLMAALDTEQPRAAWSDAHYELEQSSWPVRAFYRVWTALPYNQPGRIGVGVYAMNAAGRARFGEFPDIISDDGFIRGQFPQAEERVIVRSCQTRVRAPHDLQSLVAVRIRSRMGVMEMYDRFPEVLTAHHSNIGESQTGKIIPLNLWPLIPIYAGVILYTKWQAKKRLITHQNTWIQDLTTRIDSIK